MRSATTAGPRWALLSRDAPPRPSAAFALLAVVFTTLLLVTPSHPARADAVRIFGHTIATGDVRFEVLSPTLIRLEHSDRGDFEDRPTMTATNRDISAPFDARQVDGWLVVTTSAMTVRYRLGSGPFAPATLSVLLADGRTGRPRFPAPIKYVGPPSSKSLASTAYVRAAPDYKLPTSGNLGGWYRALDGTSGPVHLHDGLLDTRGWYLLDDSDTVVTTDHGKGFVARPGGDYQDGYLFGYGHDYRQGLQDLAHLVGNAPILPRNAFGVWSSKYNRDSQASYGPLVRRFQKARINLGVVNLDTDAKGPHVWNGWEWSPTLFPHPAAFIRQMHRRGIDIGLNIHPSIAADDPKFLDANQSAGGLAVVGGLREDTYRCRSITFGSDLGLTGFTDIPPSGETTGLGEADCRLFDLDHAAQQRAYLHLHDEFLKAGVDLFWLDYCCDESAATNAGAADPWFNKLYAGYQRAHGSRWPVLSRIGGSLFDLDTDTRAAWSERRTTIHFTGDTQSTWKSLRFQAPFTAAEGNSGLPYVSHDIGGFLGQHLPDDLYVRWVQAGTFAPIMRLHSNHGDRLPWEYGARARRIASTFLRLRGELVPYLASTAHLAATTGTPMTRAMYLQWPQRHAAYRHPEQFMLGDDLLVAPVSRPGQTAKTQVWFPPGAWTDLFTGQRFVGPATRTLDVPLDRMPVFRREGSILPRQEYDARGLKVAPRHLVLDVARGRTGRFRLVEDASTGLADRSAATVFSQRRAAGRVELLIGAAGGAAGLVPGRRTYELRIDGVRSPSVVRIDGQRVTDWRVERGVLVVRTPSLSTLSSHRIQVR